MSKNHTGESTEPYWLIREPGRKHGFGTVPFNGDTDPQAALTRYWETLEPVMRDFMHSLEHDPGVTATLVTLAYVNGQPIVSPVAL